MQFRRDGRLVQPIEGNAGLSMFPADHQQALLSEGVGATSAWPVCSYAWFIPFRVWFLLPCTAAYFLMQQPGVPLMVPGVGMVEGVKSELWMVLISSQRWIHAQLRPPAG